MIKLTQVSVKSGQVTLVFSYSASVVAAVEEKGLEAVEATASPVTIEVPEEEVLSRLRKLQALTGLVPTEQDRKTVLVALVKEVSSGKARFPRSYDYSKLIDVDLDPSSVSV